MTSPRNSAGVLSARSRHRIRPENNLPRSESTPPAQDTNNANNADGEMDLRQKYKLEDLDLKTTLGECRFAYTRTGA